MEVTIKIILSLSRAFKIEKKSRICLLSKILNFFIKSTAINNLLYSFLAETMITISQDRYFTRKKLIAKFFQNILIIKNYCIAIIKKRYYKRTKILIKEFLQLGNKVYLFIYYSNNNKNITILHISFTMFQL